MVLPEPVEEWQNVNGTDLLDLMFHNGTRYFGTFQLESTFTRYLNNECYLKVLAEIEFRKMIIIMTNIALQVEASFEDSASAKPKSRSNKNNSTNRTITL